MLARPVDLERLRTALRRAPVVLLVGPRQAGKTTLARQLADPRRSNNFDAEYPPDAARLAEPLLALENLDGLVLIDEAQHVPDLFPVLRVFADRPGRPAQFLVLGSASPELVGLAAESLAGRVEIVELAGLRAVDVGLRELDRLWVRGGLPPSFTAADGNDSAAWRDNYMATFLERDLAQLGFRIPSTSMRRAWTSLAHRHGQLWSGAELARSLDVAQSTARRYLDALTDSLVVRQLQPWFANVEKRQVKSPKVYVRDAGLLHRLVGVGDLTELTSHPVVGASWEGFVIEQVAMILGQTPLYFWRTHQGAELDLYVEVGGLRLGFEIKRTAQPRITRSMHIALDDLALDKLVVVYPGDVRIQLAERMVAVPLANLLTATGADELTAIVR